MRKSSMTTRLLGMPVVPPVSKTYAGLPARPLGIQRLTGPPRSWSSWKWSKRVMSANDFTSLRGSQPAFFAQSSQKGEPVSGLKCHCIMSRTWASRRSRACRTLGSEDGFICSAARTAAKGKPVRPPRRRNERLALRGRYRLRLLVRAGVRRTFLGAAALGAFLDRVDLVLGHDVERAVGEDGRAVDGVAEVVGRDRLAAVALRLKDRDVAVLVAQVDLVADDHRRPPHRRFHVIRPQRRALLRVEAVQEAGEVGGEDQPVGDGDGGDRAVHPLGTADLAVLVRVVLLELPHDT